MPIDIDLVHARFLDAEAFIPRFNNLPLSFREPLREPFYSEWITLQPSVISGKHPCDPEHAISKGRGGKNSSDLYLIPITRNEHGESTKNRKWLDQFEPRILIVGTLEEWIRVTVAELKSHGICPQDLLRHATR